MHFLNTFTILILLYNIEFYLQHVLQFNYNAHVYTLGILPTFKISAWQIPIAKKILSTPSFGGEVNPSVPCRRFTACKRSQNGVEVVISAKLPGKHSRPQFHLPTLGSLASWRTWESLNAEESNGKLPLRTCPGCSVPEPYQSHERALVSAQTGPRAQYL